MTTHFNLVFPKVKRVIEPEIGRFAIDVYRRSNNEKLGSNGLCFSDKERLDEPTFVQVMIPLGNANLEGGIEDIYWVLKINKEKVDDKLLEKVIFEPPILEAIKIMSLPPHIQDEMKKMDDFFKEQRNSYKW